MELSQAVGKFLNHQKSMSTDQLCQFWINLAQFEAFIIDCNSCYKSEITNATPVNVQKFLEYVWNQENKNVKKITKVMKSLNDFDQYCLEHRWLTSSMMNGVTLPNVSRTTKVKPIALTYIPPLLYSAIVAKLLRGPLAPSLKHRVMFLLLVMTGIRVGELKNITWSDIDFENKWIIVKSTKSGEKRVVPLFYDLSVPLQDYKNDVENTESDQDLIFPGYQPIELTRIFQKFLNDHGFIKGLVSLRSLRSTFVKQLYLSTKDRSLAHYIAGSKYFSRKDMLGSNPINRISNDFNGGSNGTTKSS